MKSHGPRSDHALTPEQKTDARAALAKLREAASGLSLLACVLVALDKKAEAVAPTAVATAKDRFLQAVLSRGKRPATFRFYDEKLGIFADWVGTSNMHEVTHPAFTKWLTEVLPGSRSYHHGIMRAVRTLYRWGMRQHPPLCSEDPTAGMTLESMTHAPIRKRAKEKFIALEDCDAMLRNVPKQFLPALALQLFAGIRPEEIAPMDPGKGRLQWEHIKFVERTIRVEDYVSKTGKARVLEDLPEAVWAWLAGHEADKGPVCDVALNSLQKAERKAGGFGKRKPWPHDGPRHTFITFAVNLTRNVGQVSLWAGHEGKTNLIHTTYMGLTDKATSQAFFGLRP